MRARFLKGCGGKKEVKMSQVLNYAFAAVKKVAGI